MPLIAAWSVAAFNSLTSPSDSTERSLWGESVQRRA
jgi:hypothetical protein